MVYESDFYTTRRPYRTTPSYSTYTTSSGPSRQVRILPGLGKVHVVHQYDRIVPYVGHKRLTVVTLPPKVWATRPSVLQREYDWIENKVRPWVSYSATNRYLNSDSAVRYVYVRNPITGIKYFDDYVPSRYHNFYRITRPLSTYYNDADYWPYLSSAYAPKYWPSHYRTLSYLDDVPVYRSLRLQRTGWPLNSYRGWYDNRYGYYRYYRPLSLYYDRYWPTALSSCYYDYPSSYYSRWSNYYDSLSWPLYRAWRYLPDTYRSYYWSRYLPISYSNGYTSSYYADYLNSIFDDETRAIRAHSASLLRAIHAPVPRLKSSLILPINRYDDISSLPARYSNDTYIHRLLTHNPRTSQVEYATYYTEPVKKYFGERGINRRRPLTHYEDPVKNDIQLLSYYIAKFRQDKSQAKDIKVPLSPARPSRIFTVQKPLMDEAQSKEMQQLREDRAARLANIYRDDDYKPRAAATAAAPNKSEDVDAAVRAKKEKEAQRLAEERALAEEQARKEASAKKEEAARKAELARQEELAAQAAAERAAELERQAELTRQEEAAKQAEIEKARRAEEDKARQEEERRLGEEAKAEEERQQLLRLEEIARQAEAEKEADLARQADELAELARQEAELAELERQERELTEAAAREAEAADLARQEAELAELERQEAELNEAAEREAEAAERAKGEAEAAERAKGEAEAARREAEAAELAQQEAELAELERQQAELDALEAEAKALEAEATSGISVEEEEGEGEEAISAPAAAATEEIEEEAAEEEAAEEEVEEEEEEE